MEKTDIEQFNIPSECKVCSICGQIPNDMEMDCGFQYPVCPNKSK